MIANRRLLVLPICTILVAGASRSQEREDASVRATTKDVAQQYAVPDIPAFSFLGASPAVVDRPNSVRDLIVGMTSAVDSAGRVLQGIAFEISPWYLIPGFDVSLDDYQKSWKKFVIANTRLSLCSVRAAGDSGSTDMALGLRITLLDDGDPMQSKEYAKSLAAAIGTARPDLPGGGISDAALGERVDPLRLAWNRDHWNARRLSLAGAAGLRFLGSQVTQSHGLGGGIWMSGNSPLGRRSQLLGEVEYSYRRRLGIEPRVAKLTYAARLNVGSPRVNGFAEVGNVNRFASDDKDSDDSSGLWSSGVEFRVSDGVWMSTGFGSTFATEQRPDRILLIADIRWGIASSARFDNP